MVGVTNDIQTFHHIKSEHYLFHTNNHNPKDIIRSYSTNILKQKKSIKTHVHLPRCVVSPFLMAEMS